MLSRGRAKRQDDRSFETRCNRKSLATTFDGARSLVPNDVTKRFIWVGEVVGLKHGLAFTDGGLLCHLLKEFP
jgi:hypothetical protein